MPSPNQIFREELMRLSGVSEEYAHAAFYTNDNSHYQPLKEAKRYFDKYLT